MESKTPQFDQLIGQVLKDLVPHTRTCKWKGEHSHCVGEFEIDQNEVNFLKKFQVPPPNFCPTCRRMKRLVHMNMLRLFKRNCDAPGHTEQMISILPPDSPFPIFDYKYYISDEFDAFSYGKEYKDGESPMEQLLSLRRIFPMPSFLNRDPSSINSEYSNGGRNSKNAYYTMAVFDSGDVWYSNLVRNSREIMDSRMVQFSDQVYASLDSTHIYKSSFIYFSKDCTDSMFLFDCRNTDSCFGCVNQRNAKYKIWNEQKTKEEYEEFVKNLYPLSNEKIKEFKEKFWKLVKSLPANASRNLGSENVTGVGFSNTRNAHDSSDSMESENIRYVDGSAKNSDSMDVLFSGGGSNHLYACTNVGSSSSNMKFCISTKFSTDSEFVFNSNNLSNCFMCFGLRDKSYCVLNKQYTSEEYFKLVDSIKCEMLRRGEYGDILDMRFSAQAYNFSMGQMSFPLSDSEILKLGGYVSQEQKTDAPDIKTLTVDQIPSDIEEVDEELVLNSAITSGTRPFRVIGSELAFYKKRKLPIPDRHPMDRIYDNFEMLPICRKYEIKCAKCSKDTYSAIDPSKGFILYCEKCYQSEVY